MVRNSDFTVWKNENVIVQIMTKEKLPARGGPNIQPKLSMQRLWPSASVTSSGSVRRTTTSAHVGPTDDTKKPKMIPEISIPIFEAQMPHMIKNAPVRNTATAWTAAPLVLGCWANMLKVSLPAKMMQVQNNSFIKKQFYHHWLAEIPAPVGSQDVAGHTHESLVLLGWDPLLLKMGGLWACQWLPGTQRE